MKTILTITVLGFGIAAMAFAASADETKAAGMVWVPGDEFTMGTDDAKSQPNERPAHRARVDGFWMDATDVTNAEFAKFVSATGYLSKQLRPSHENQHP